MVKRFSQYTNIDDAWPSVLIDQQTINDFQKTMEFLKRAGYTDIDLFGLLTNRDWPMDIESVLTPREKSSRPPIIHIIHSNGLQLIYGLGVYSWGLIRLFKTIQKFEDQPFWLYVARKLSLKN